MSVILRNTCIRQPAYDPTSSTADRCPGNGSCSGGSKPARRNNRANAGYRHKTEPSQEAANAAHCRTDPGAVNCVLRNVGSIAPVVPNSELFATMLMSE